MPFFVATEFTFLYPLALLLPLILVALILLKRKRGAAVRHPHVKVLQAIPKSLRLRARGPVLHTLSLLAILFLSIAAARPQRVGTIEQRRSARNIMLCLDISRSMQATDFRAGMGSVSRLKAVKSVVAEFIASRSEDRIGLVVFGTDAFLQAPLTFDHKLLEEFVDRLQVGLAGDGTAIGDGLGLSLKRIQDIDADSKAIVLLTDGVSNSDQVNPLKAAQMARMLGIKVHTIGIGSSEPVHLRGPGFFSRVEYDEKTLQQIAEISEGVYFNAKDLEGLKRVYEEISILESSEKIEPESQYVEELFLPYTLAGLAAYLLYLILGNTVFTKLP